MKHTNKNTRLYWLIGTIWILVCVVLGVTAWTAVKNPVFASILDTTPASAPEILWAQVEISKPVVSPIDVSVFASQDATENIIPEDITPTAGAAPESLESSPAQTDAVANTPAPSLADAQVDSPTSVPAESSGSDPAAAFAAAPGDTPTAIPAETAVDVPTAVPGDVPINTPEVIETPAQLAMEVVPNTPTSEYVPPPTSSAPKQQQSSYASSGNGARWIDVDLSNQSLYAYEGDVLVNSFIVSTGTWQTPTVTGQYNVYVKYRSAPMSGPGYYLPNVPYIMYFYGDYGLHGTYWHNNFGTPMSHGCVNLRTADAGWLYNWASVGTLVNVHY
jgi:lipoprotein-anchoring transpeptidase ErfK/SrfK